MDSFINEDQIDLYYVFFFSEMSHLKEIDHIPDELFVLNQNKKNTIFENQQIIVNENCMAISFTAFDLLYKLCEENIFEFKKQNDNKNYDDNKEAIAKVLKVTKIMLCLNGENNSAFNVRIFLLEKKEIKNLEEELGFSRLVCLRFKKSSIAWFYRFKLTQKMIENITVTTKLKAIEEALFNLYEKEIDFILLHLLKHPRNYYAWSYRQKIFNDFWDLFKNSDNFLLKEIERVRTYCQKNVHEYSAFHFLQVLFKKLGKRLNVQEEISWTINLILLYEDYYEKDSEYIKLVSLRKHMIFLENFKI